MAPRPSRALLRAPGHRLLCGTFPTPDGEGRGCLRAQPSLWPPTPESTGRALSTVKCSSEDRRLGRL